MAGQSRRLVIEILGDARDVQRALRDTDSALDRSGRTAMIAGGAMMAAGGLAARGLWEAAQAAADDERAAAALATTLRNTTGATEDQVAAVEDYITATQNSTGVLDDQLRPAFDRLVRSTGDVTEAQGLMQTALDISAGTGRDLEAVSMALGRAHDGNVAGLSRLGIATRDAAGQTMSFEEVMASANDVFGGQAAAAAETTAGQMAILHAKMQTLKEEVGAAVIPILMEGADVIGGMADRFIELNEATDGAAGKIAIGATGFLLFGGAVTTVVGKLMTMRDTLRTVQDSRLAQWASANRTAIVGLTAVVTAGVLAWQDYQERQANVEARTRSFTDALRSEDSALAAMTDVLTPIIEDTDLLREAMAESGVTATDLASALLNQGAEWDSVRERLIGASDDFRTMDLVLDSTQDSMRDARDRAADLSTVVDDVGGSAGRARGPVDDLGSSFDESRQGVVHFRDNMREATEQIQLHIDKVSEWLSGQLDYRTQLRETNDALTTYADAEGDLNDVYSDRSEAGDAVIAQLAETAAAYAVEQGAVEGSREAVDLQLESLQAMRSFIPAELLPMLDAYILRLGSVPTNIDVNINQMVRTFEGTGTVAGGGPTRGVRAAGGPVMPGGSYLVGENGPELLTMGSASGYVHANGGGGAMQPIVIQLDGRTIGEALVRSSRNGGPVVVTTR